MNRVVKYTTNGQIQYIYGRLDAEINLYDAYNSAHITA